MTRILPASGAELAHFSPRQGRDWYRQASDDARNIHSEGRQQGNRRLGDRRTESRRAGGRRLEDHRVRQSAPTWLSATFGAHLIGQAEGQSPVTPQAAINAYASNGVSAKRRNGGTV